MGCRFVVPALVAVLAAPSAQATVEATWIADFDAAAKQAKESGKDLFVDFTGSGWCGYCTMLHDEVFATESFAKAVGDHYVLVALDFDNQGNPKESNPNPERDRALLEQHKVGGFPTVLLMTAEGEVFGRTGYRPGGAEGYLTHLAELRSGGKATLAELAEIEGKVATATGADLDALLDRAVAKLAEQPAQSPFADRLAVLARRAFTSDPENAAGRRLKALIALAKAGTLEAEEQAAGRTLDPKNENGLLERIVLAELSAIKGPDELPSWLKKVDELDALGAMKDPEVAFNLLMNATVFNARIVKDAVAAKRWAAKVRTCGFPIPPRAEQMLAAIEKS